MYHRYLGIRQFEEGCPDLAAVTRWTNFNCGFG